MSDNREANDLKSLCKDAKDSLESSNEDMQNSASGVGGSRKIEGVPGYWQLERRDNLLKSKD